LPLNAQIVLGIEDNILREGLLLIEGLKT